jgi:hypothetical protein
MARQRTEAPAFGLIRMLGVGSAARTNNLDDDLNDPFPFTLPLFLDHSLEFS